MSWFQTGLSSLTGQIGNFTREVLTEGTEEVEDFETQLKVAKARLDETESICSAQRKELEQLKKFNDELRVQMESKELQMQSISTNFRETLIAKEKDLVALKKRELELVGASHSPRKDSFNDAAEDSEDVLLLQHKISSLQSKISGLESELRKHKTQHKESPVGDDFHANSEEKIWYLEKKVKALDEELLERLDRHQHEFVSLQHSHQQSLTSLKKSHLNTVEQLKDKIQRLETTLTERDSPHEGDGNARSQDSGVDIPTGNAERLVMIEKLDHLEKRNAKLEFDSAQVHAVDRKKTELIEKLQVELGTCREDVEALSQKLQKEILSKEDISKEFDLLLEENQTLMDQLNTMKLNQKEESKSKKRKELEGRGSKSNSDREDEGESLDDFESKIIQLKKELMGAENARIAESELCAEKVGRLEEELKTAGEDLKRVSEESKEAFEKAEAEKSDLAAEKEFLKRRVSELDDQIKELAENFAESQKMRESVEAILAMERRDREFGAILDRDLFKQKNLELERELQKSAAELSDADGRRRDVETALNRAKEDIKECEVDAAKRLESVEESYKEEILKLKVEVAALKESWDEKDRNKEISRANEISREVDLPESELRAREKLELFGSDAEECGRTLPGGSDGCSAGSVVEMEKLRKEMKDLREELEQAESISRLYESEVERLSSVEKKLEELQRSNQELLENYGRLSGEDSVRVVDRSDTSSSLGSEKSVASESEVSALKSTVSKQEELIKTLNGKYSSVFKLLEDRSVELFGDEKVLGRLNQLQSEVECLRKEREHIMSILNDKTREASSLKVEVHRLMDAVSAGKAAVDKLQSDRASSGISTATGATADSSPSRSSGEGEENEDMKREAVRRLARMIKDKDFEIDSLNKKNGTLLQVLQSQSSESLNHEVKRLLVERDGLQKQVTSFQFERDQLINALNTKHSESIGYFEELVKQKKVSQELNAEFEKLQLSHRSMSQQLEEKQCSLIKLLDDRSNTKRLLAQLEGDRDEGANFDDEEEGEEEDGTKCSFIVGRRDDDDDEDLLHPELRVAEDVAVGKEGSNNRTDAERPKKKRRVVTRKKKRSDETNSVEDFNGDVVGERMVEKMVREKDAIIQEKEKSIGELKNKILFFESEIVRLQSMLASIDTLVKQKDSDVCMSKKQVESMNIMLQNEVTRRSEVENDLEKVQRRVETLSAESTSLKKSIAMLSSDVAQKDLELISLYQELERSESSKLPPEGHAVSSATVVNGNEVVPGAADSLGSSGGPDDEKDPAEETIREFRQREEELVKRMMLMQQEREQLYLAAHYHQNDSNEVRANLSKLQDREKRLVKECERLRDHLVTIEEGYTKEAIGAEEREKALRNQLATAQDKIASLTDSVLTDRSDLAKQAEVLQLQLHTMSEQRDNAVLQLGSAQETISGYSNSLSNLQMVLEQFQSERLSQQSLEVEKFQMAFSKKQVECQQHQNHIQQLLIQLEDYSEAIKAAQRLSEQMDKKEHLIVALRDEVRLRESELKKTEEEVKKLMSNTEAKLDKMLMKSLLIGYFHAPASKRLEAFRVIGHILNFSNEELQNIGMQGTGSVGWIEGIFGKKSSPKSQQSSLNQSFSELFVSFLERESTPNKTNSNDLRLPAERMIAEQQQKKHQEATRPTSFNPFSTPISSHAILPLSSKPPALLETQVGASKSSLLEQPSNFLTSPILPSSTYYPSIVAGRDQTQRERNSRRDSLVPIILAAAAASPSPTNLYNNSNNNDGNNHNRSK